VDIDWIHIFQTHRGGSLKASLANSLLFSN
jgi:hypothetical protein